MLIHLSPQILLPIITDKCRLIKISCPELGISLTGGVDVVGRRPFPNKRYVVACRKEGDKPVHGLLIQAPAHVPEFNVTTEWCLPDNTLLTHRVRYIVLDDEYDTISENMLSWYATSSTGGERESRWPEVSAYTSPAKSQPRMGVVKNDGRSGEITDVLNSSGNLVERQEVFRLHTIQRDRVLKPEFRTGARLPFLAEAFETKR